MKPALPDEDLDAPMELVVTRWEGDPAHCVYLNDHRIAGGKPWAGGSATKVFKAVTIRELARAIPALQVALGLDYLGNSKKENLIP